MRKHSAKNRVRQECVNRYAVTVVVLTRMHGRSLRLDGRHLHALLLRVRTILLRLSRILSTQTHKAQNERAAKHTLRRASSRLEAAEGDKDGGGDGGERAERGRTHGMLVTQRDDAGCLCAVPAVAEEHTGDATTITHSESKSKQS